MNVTEVPEQIVLEGLTTMETVGVKFGLTVIGMELDVAVAEVKQVPPTMLMSQVTALPLVNVVEVNVFDAPLCTLLPLILKS